MTQFVDSCVETAAGGAKEAVKQSRGRPKARKLLAALEGKKRILVSCHRFPDPDALGSATAVAYLLRKMLPDAAVDMSVKGDLGGGINAAFTQHASLDVVPWDDARLLDRDRPDSYDAVVLCDVQPGFPSSPLPDGCREKFDFPTAIIDHHRARGRKPNAEFVDIRTDVGATASIVFSYFMELDVVVPPDLAATLLYAVETDLAGAAGQPSDFDNVALANLTLLADTKKLYRMRNVSLPQHYFVSYANALLNASVYDNLLLSHLDLIEFIEKPAILADFLLRYNAIDWAVLTALVGSGNAEGRPDKLVISARTQNPSLSAGEMMRRALDGLGEGGGHRTKAGGYVVLENGTPTEIERVRLDVRRRLLRSLKLPEDCRGRRMMNVECDDDGKPTRFVVPVPQAKPVTTTDGP